MSTSSEKKLELPTFLKVLSSGDMPMTKAIAFATKIYKTHNTPSALGKVTDEQLKGMGVDSKEDRKMALAAFKKAGYKSTIRDPVSQSNAVAGTSKAGSKFKAVKKRKRDDDLNELPPEEPSDKGETAGNLQFNEILDEEVLKSKSAVVNRAPVMTAWAMVVAERLGFKREEALSIASAYTEMNAISKGMSIGVFGISKGKGIELTKGQSQPYVDLMGRRIPVYTTQTDEYRALLKGEPVDPSTPFSYITRSFRQTLPYILGSMRRLADTFEATELNEKGYGLYMEFRPDVENMGKKGWGERAEMRCTDILRLKVKPKSRGEEDTSESTRVNAEKEPKKEPPEKKAKSMSVEEYEAALDGSMNYDDLKFDDEF